MPWRASPTTRPPGDLRQTGIDVLCAYLRLPYTAEADIPEDQTGDRHAYLALREVRHTIIRLIRDHLRLPQDDSHSWQAMTWTSPGWSSTAETSPVRCLAAAWSASTVRCLLGGTVNFNHAAFTGGEVDFTGTTFSGGTLDFDGADFSGGTVSFSSARGAAPVGVVPAGGASAPEGLLLPAAWVLSAPDEVEPGPA